MDKNLHQHFYQIDALRGIMLLLGVVLHSGMSFMDYHVPELWPYHHSETSFIFDALIFFVHIFRVPLFFVLAGYFMERSMDKYHHRELLIKKINRIGIPLILGVFFMYPLIEFGIYYNSIISPSFSEYFDRVYDFSRINTMHLWFLYYLLVFFILRILFNKTLNTLISSFRKRYHLSMIHWLIIFCLMSYMSQQFLDKTAFHGDYHLLPNVGSIIYFLGFYLLGSFSFYYSDWFDFLMKKITIFLVIGTLCIMGISYYYFKLESYGMDFNFLQGLFYSISAYAYVLFFFGVFFKLFKHKNKTLSFLSKSSYFIYVIHLPFVFLSVLLLKNSGLNEYLFFIIILSITLLISYLLYILTRKQTWSRKQNKSNY